MRTKYLRLAAIAGSMLLGFGLPAIAQSDVQVQFTGGYSGVFEDYGAGIYTATINGNSSPGIICDDFNDEVTSGETWKATAIQASTLASNTALGETLFGGSIQIQGYAEVAMLVSTMFSNASSLGGVNGILPADISAAIWYITTPGGITGLDKNASALVAYVTGLFGGSGATPAQITSATNYLESLTNLWILTPDPKGYAPPGEATEPQEMWTTNLVVSAPEGGTLLMYLLLAGGSCFGAMFFRPRKRAVSQTLA